MAVHKPQNLVHNGHVRVGELFAVVRREDLAHLFKVADWPDGQGGVVLVLIAGRDEQVVRAADELVQMRVIIRVEVVHDQQCPFARQLLEHLQLAVKIGFGRFAVRPAQVFDGEFLAGDQIEQIGRVAGENNGVVPVAVGLGIALGDLALADASHALQKQYMFFFQHVGDGLNLRFPPHEQAVRP